MSRRTDIIVTLLPEPDSPTIPSTSPWPSVNETPSTARTTPSSVLKETLRSRTSRSGGGGAAGNGGQAGRDRGAGGAEEMSTRAVGVGVEKAARKEGGQNTRRAG